MDFFEFLAMIDSEASRIGWSTNDLKRYVLSKYGKKSRYLMTDGQLWELYEYLRLQPNAQAITPKSKIAIPKIRLRK